MGGIRKPAPWRHAGGMSQPAGENPALCPILCFYRFGVLCQSGAQLEFVRRNIDEIDRIVLQKRGQIDGEAGQLSVGFSVIVREDTGFPRFYFPKSIFFRFWEIECCSAFLSASRPGTGFGFLNCASVILPGLRGHGRSVPAIWFRQAPNASTLPCKAHTEIDKRPLDSEFL